MTSALRKRMTGDALLKRTRESHQRMNEYGKYGRFYKAPEGKQLKIWKCKEGEHIIDIIPFLAGNKHHQTKQGDPTYLVDIWVHQKIGANQNDMVCTARNYNEPCPICEYCNEMNAKETLLTPEELTLPKEQQIKLLAAKEAFLSSLEPKRRCLYNIVCYDSSRESDYGVQIWEIAHFLFEKKLLSIARNPRGGGFVPFSNPDTGKNIYFERQGSGFTNTQYLGHKFIDRQTPITDEILASAYILDELVHIPTYKETKDEFLSGIRTSEAFAQTTPVEQDDIPKQTNKVAEKMAAAKREEAAKAKAEKEKAAAGKKPEVIPGAKTPPSDRKTSPTTKAVPKKTGSQRPRVGLRRISPTKKR